MAKPKIKSTEKGAYSCSVFWATSSNKEQDKAKDSLVTLDPRSLRTLYFIHTCDPSAPPEERAEEHKYHYF